MYNCISKLKEMEEERGLQRAQTAGQAVRQKSDPGEALMFRPIKEQQILNNVPPTLAYSKSYHFENLELLYKIFNGDTKLIRSTLEAHGFTHTESHEWNILWSPGSCKTYLYEGLNEFQKINHFPSSNEITRKDYLCRNLVRMQEKYGKQYFDFIPDTYVLPDEFGDFYSHFQRQKQTDQKKNLWIVKPANLSRGRGIYIVDDISEVNVDDISVISKYVSNPLLINGHKFDLRIYVLVTSFDPLRIYVFKEGLARFASEKYSNKNAKSNKFMHLTNYSINKKNNNYIQNDNLEQDDFGFKWSLTAFCKHLETIGIDMNLFWSRIFDVIIKSIISGENSIFNAVKKTCIHKTNCFELFGFDILIDSDLKPWLIEINLSPSLACESAIDHSIKSQLIADTFNLVGIKKYDRRKESANKAKNRMKSYNNRGKNMSSKFQNLFNPVQDRSGLNFGGVFQMQGTSVTNSSCDNFQQAVPQTLHQQIDYLCQNDIQYKDVETTLRKMAGLKYKEVIRDVLGEYQRKGSFVRIYPAHNSNVYDVYFQQSRPVNKLIYKLLFEENSFNIQPREQPKLNYKMEIPATTGYDFYKNKQVDSKRQSIDNSTIQSQVEIESRPEDVTRNSRAQSMAPVSSKSTKEINASTLSAKKSDDGGRIFQTQKGDKVMVTGDDILIEYADRLQNALKQIQDSQIKVHWRSNIEKFIAHQVWHQADLKERPCLANRINNRLSEMRERRKRLLKYMYKKDGKLPEFERGFQATVARKTNVLRKFNNKQLENLLRSSTKNVALEVVQTVIAMPNGPGILLELERAFNLNFKARQEEGKVPGESENSMANAETEDEDPSIAKNQRLTQSRTSTRHKNMLLSQADESYQDKQTKNNFFRERLVSPNVGAAMMMRQSSAVGQRGAMPPKSAQPGSRRKAQSKDIKSAFGNNARGIKKRQSKYFSHDFRPIYKWTSCEFKSEEQ